MPDMPDYRDITATVRTPRCAILLNRNSEYWQAGAKGIISLASEVWGGRHFIIIPTDGQVIADKFWEILKAYSPDYIVFYQATFADLKDADPNMYAEGKAHSRSRWGGDLDEFDARFTEEAGQAHIEEFAVSEDLIKQLINRLSPFHMPAGVLSGRLTRTDGFDFPFTKIRHIVAAAREPIRKAVVPRPVADLMLGLVIYSRTGFAQDLYKKELHAVGLTVEELPENYDDLDFLKDVVGGITPVTVEDGEAWRPDSDYMPHTPFSLSMLHLVEYYRIEHHREDVEPLTLVLGESVEDFCLYYSLSRLHKNVVWLPLTWLRDSYRQTMRNRRRQANGAERIPIPPEKARGRELLYQFQRLNHFGFRANKIELRSMSLSPKQLVEYRKQMAVFALGRGERIEQLIKCVPIEKSSTECVARVFEENNYLNNRSAIFVNRASVSPLDTPKPKNFVQINLPHHFWITSLDIKGFHPPSLPRMGTSILPGQSIGGARVAEDGVAFFCPNGMYFGGDVDVNTVRPNMYLPDPMEMFGSYFEELGISIQYSDKGRYLADTLRRFGGLAVAAAFIKAPETRNLLDKFMAKANQDKGEVIYLDNDQRAYINFSAVQRSLGSLKASADLVDTLAAKEILHRGYLLQCDRCRLASWYALGEFSNTFTCGRCSYRQPLSWPRWKSQEEPHWYYKLAETVYQFYKHNSHLTVQTLATLQAESRQAFHFVPELDLHGFPGNKPKRELDVACVVDGKIVLGECKTGDLQASDVKKFLTIDGLAAKRPDRIVFATQQSTVSDAFQAQAKRLPNVTLLTRPSLYDI